MQGLTPAPMPPTHYDVFLSRKSQDAHLAKELYDFLTSKGLKVFDSDHSLQEMGNADYSRAIDDALVNTEHLIVVGSSVENISSPWVEAEWRFFLNRKRSGKINGNLLTVITEQDLIEKLPPSLQNYECIQFSKANFYRILTYATVHKEPSNKLITSFELKNKEIEEWIKLGDYEYVKGNLDIAEELYQKVLKVEDNIEINNRLGKLYLAKAVKVEENAKLAYLFPSITSLVLLIPGAFFLKNALFKDAIKYFEKASSIGDPESNTQLGWFYENGKGVEKNIEKAVDYYRVAAVQGDADAQNNLKRLNRT